MVAIDHVGVQVLLDWALVDVLTEELVGLGDDES